MSKQSDQGSLFGDDFPQVRCYIREQLQSCAFGRPSSKRDLGAAAVGDLLDRYGDDAVLRGILESLAVRGAAQIAGEELRKVRVRFRQFPSIKAFYAVVRLDPEGRRQYLQAAVGGMTRAEIQRVMRRMRKQGERGLEVSSVFGAFWQLPTWGDGQMTLNEAAEQAGEGLEVFVEELGS